MWNGCLLTQNLKKPLFDLGRTVATPGAIEALQQAGISAASLLCRHQCGDWGDLGHEGLDANEAALHQGSRIFSSYQLTDTVKIWVITEADRSATTLLLPEEY
jgi:hypothetical protein